MQWSDAMVKERVISEWANFPTLARGLGQGWLYRGQRSDWPLKSSLERWCGVCDVTQDLAPAIEKQLLRDFRRKYDGDDYDAVRNDTLYCLALMQHHGAPTRLTDWTYSPFVAAYFALERAETDCFVWCINYKWLLHARLSVVPEIERRMDDKERDDTTWSNFYTSSHKFVSPENPFRLNRRLMIQQGAFLCPGDLSVSFIENLAAMNGWHDPQNIVKLRLEPKPCFREQAMEELYQMNVSRATLFPGLDGFAQSLGPRLPYYVELAKDQTGQSAAQRAVAASGPR